MFWLACENIYLLIVLACENGFVNVEYVVQWFKKKRIFFNEILNSIKFIRQFGDIDSIISNQNGRLYGCGVQIVCYQIQQNDSSFLYIDLVLIFLWEIYKKKPTEVYGQCFWNIATLWTMGDAIHNA